MNTKRGTNGAQHRNSSRIDVIDIDAIDVDAIETEINNNLSSTTVKNHELQPTFSHPSQSDLEPEELLQPYIDIHQLFTMLNRKHFDGRIQRTYVEYSSRMTLCAGTCTFRGAGGCRIGLSEPLLKLRPRSDLISTLLHEMIHAYLFETLGIHARDGVDGHGPKFMAHAERINKAESGKVNITPYHSFNDEVDLYRTHHWKCMKCEKLIKRAMNRAPGPHDYFWANHLQNCGGCFKKIAEPPRKKRQTKSSFKGHAVAVDTGNKHTMSSEKVMKTHRVDRMLRNGIGKKSVPRTVQCPVCTTTVKEVELNNHLDECLAEDVMSQPVIQQEQMQKMKQPGSVATSRVDPKNKNEHTDEPEISIVHEVIAGNESQKRISSSNLESDLDRTKRIRRRENILTDKESSYDVDKMQLHCCVKDFDAFADLAFNPTRFFSTPSQQLFHQTTPNNQHTKHTKHSPQPSQPSHKTPNVHKLLHPLIKPESSYLLHERGRHKLQSFSLQHVQDKDMWIETTARRLGMSEHQLIAMIEATGRKDTNGTFHIPEQIIRLLLSKTPLTEEQLTFVRSYSTSTPSNHSSSPKRTTRNADTDGDNGADNGAGADIGTNSKTATHMQSNWKIQPRPGNAGYAGDTNIGGNTGNTRNIGMVIESDNCPICDKVIPKSQLQIHVSKCLDESEVAPHIFSDDHDHDDGTDNGGADVVRGNGPSAIYNSNNNHNNNNNGNHNNNRNNTHTIHKQVSRNVTHPHTNSTYDTNTASKSSIHARCPICEKPVPRPQLEAHVNLCMVSMGLDDAF